MTANKMGRAVDKTAPAPRALDIRIVPTAGANGNGAALTAAELLAEAVNGRRPGPNRKARCPAHDDRKASFSIRVEADGLILVKCFAGCTAKNIVEAAGFTLADLAAPAERHGELAGNGRSAKARPVTLLRLAEAKRLDPAALREFGVYDQTGAVAITYTDPTTGESIIKRRSALSAKEGSRWPKATPLMPYGLDRLPADRGGPLYIVEGESDCWTLWAHGKAAVGIPGASAAGCLAERHAALLAGFPLVYVIEETGDDGEPDNGGKIFPAAVAARLAEIGVAAAVKVLRLPAKDPSALHIRNPDGFNAALAAAEAVATVVGGGGGGGATTTAAPAEQPDPEPWPAPVLLDELAELPLFPADALGRLLNEFAVALAEAFQVPLDMPALLLLGALAACTGGRFVVIVRPGWREPVNLYIAVAMLPGNRKSAVVSVVCRPLTEWEAEAAALAAPEIEAARTRQAIAQKTHARAVDAAAKSTDPAERASLVQQAEAAAKELAGIKVPAVPRLLTDDCTPERLVGLLAEQNGRIAVLSPEGGVFDVLAGGRYSKNGSTNLDPLLKAHAGDPIRTDRVGRPDEFVASPALTLALAVQPEVIRGLVDRPGFQGRGLLARFAYAVPQSLVGRRNVRPEPVPPALLAAWSMLVRRLLESGGADGTVELRFTPEAAERLLSFSAVLEPRLGPAGDLSDIAEWGSKLAGAVARIAGLLTLADRAADGDALADPIEADAVKRAVRIGDYLTMHALAAFRLMGASPDAEAARHLLRWIVANRQPTFSRADAFRDLRRGRRFAKPEALEKPLALLTEHGYIRPLNQPQRPGAGRRPAARFAVNSAAFSGDIPDPRNPQNPPNRNADPDCVDNGDLVDRPADLDTNDRGDGLDGLFESSDAAEVRL